ncbi:hypothetical protein OE88DRAFT_1711915 [Heliocybe sulcata]|uniref:T6SS Phospholipase effector Tle1-like catalytic domain-containing protein n=1 Tax=Heliocybe sulcata TaxID=5364 RepID=A0A5C3N4V1_9AGAM|nr:hypothetical protein OE88DRAFT_1711915 [Heliocybe sulcata]
MQVSDSTTTTGDGGARRPRTIILCFDGTSNQYDGNNTNVVNFFSLLKKNDFSEQLCYYQPGIGTYFNPGVVSPIFQWIAKIADEAFAWYLNEHVMDGYRFLMNNYCEGDKICLFGFSRGAYTARGLAGMLHKVGLLPKDNDAQVPFAYKLYARTDAEGMQLCAGFKQTFCQNVRIEFVGVWETVASVGVVVGKALPFTTSNTTIKTFRHALSLDEHRAKFQPNLYHRPAPNAQGAAKDPEHASPPISASATFATSQASLLKAKGGKAGKVGSVRSLKMLFMGGRQGVNGKGKGKDVESGEGERKERLNGDGNGEATDPAAPDDPDCNSTDIIDGGTDVKEVWFAGVHSDVGGGAVSNATKQSLADITLRWMVREVMMAQCGVQFDNEALRRLDIPEFAMAIPAAASQPRVTKQATLGLDHKKEVTLSVPGTTATPPNPADGEGAGQTKLDLIDAVQSEHDELGWKGKWAWWLLEIIPTSYAWQDKDGVWHKNWCIHFGKGRSIPDPNPQFHVTVKERMDDAKLKYKPRASWTGNPVYVED